VLRLFDSLRRFFAKHRLGEAVVVVSGLPRSGTSMLMNMLRAGGLEIVTDEARTADEDNPRGYFEDERVKALDRSSDKGWLRDARGKVVKIISFLLKDLPDDCRYQVLFMHRDLDEVLASQNKMLERRGESGGDTDDERMKQLYRTHLRKVELLLAGNPNFERLDVHYRQVLAAPREEAERIARFLGRDLDRERMATAVEPALYRNRAGA
jgi:hypothetical protein